MTERWTIRVEEDHYLVDDSARQAYVETAYWGLPTTTGHYICTMVITMIATRGPKVM